MIIITGPRSNDDEVGLLAEMAGLLDAVPAYSVTTGWATATALYALTGWEKCSMAVADVAIAEACGIPLYELTA